MLTETDCIQLATYLMQVGEIKYLTVAQVKQAYVDLKSERDTASFNQYSSEDARYDAEMDLYEEILKRFS